MVKDEEQRINLPVHDAVSRLGAFSIVVLLHVAVLTARWLHIVPESQEPRSLTWINVEPQADAPPPESERITPAREQQDFAVRPALAPVSPAISPPLTDWRASVETAAISAAARIIRQEAYRPLGPIERGESGSSHSSAIFERPSRRAGDIDYDPVQGRTLVWHGEHCYTEIKFPTIKDPNELKGLPNPPKCIFRFGKNNARGDLLDEIKKR